MKKKIILYGISQYPQKRVFEKIQALPGIEQYIIVPNIGTQEELVIKEGYKSLEKVFDKVIRYRKSQEIEKIINKINPDIFVDAATLLNKRKILSKKCKKVFVSHGMINNYTSKLITGPMKMPIDHWKGYDLYCGATQIFSDFVKFAANVGEDKILLNAMPQFDLLCDQEYQNSYKDEILSLVGAKDKGKIVLFAGFCDKENEVYSAHNEDYFKVAIKLEEIAKNNNWFVFVKPRVSKERTLDLLKEQVYYKKYINKYMNILDSKHVYFLHPKEMIYRYFFSDLIILNGASTLEVEACAAQKPIFIIRTNDNSQCDYFNTRLYKASRFISDIKKLEKNMLKYFNYGLYHNPNNQKRLLEYFNLTIDGCMTQRVQNKLEQMLF